MTSGDGLLDAAIRTWWDPLERAALLVLLDPAAAREVTVAAYRDLGSAGPVRDPAASWLTLWGLVLRRSLAHPPTPATAPFVAPRTAPGDGPTDTVADALAGYLRTRGREERAFLAATEVLEVDTARAAVLMDRPFEHAAAWGVATAHGVDEVRAEVLAARPKALTRGHEQDVRDALGLLVAGHVPPPDPLATVLTGWSRITRRRILVGAGFAALAVTAGAVAVRIATFPDGPEVDDAVITPVVLPPAGDPVWESIDTWPTRGPLASHPGLEAFRAARLAPGTRILWAGDLGTRRLVLAHGEPSEDDPSNARVFSGPAGSILTDLEQVLSDSLYWGAEPYAVTIGDGPDPAWSDRTLLVVLTSPDAGPVEFCTGTAPLPSGEVDQTWTLAPLEGGVFTSVLDRTVPAGALTRSSGELQPVGTMVPLGFEYEPTYATDDEVIANTDAYVAAFTTLRRDQLRSQVVTRDAVDESFFSSTPIGGTGAVDVVVVLTRTPSGACIRSVIGVLPGGQGIPFSMGTVVPADDIDLPAMVLNGSRPRVLLLHPPADSVQVVLGGSAGASEEIPAKGHQVTLVELPADMTPEFTVVLRDSAGRHTHRLTQRDQTLFARPTAPES